MNTGAKSGSSGAGFVLGLLLILAVIAGLIFMIISGPKMPDVKGFGNIANTETNEAPVVHKTKTVGTSLLPTLPKKSVIKKRKTKKAPVARQAIPLYTHSKVVVHKDWHTTVTTGSDGMETYTRDLSHLNLKRK